MDASEKILITLMKSGNSFAFEEIYQRYHKKVYGFASRMLERQEDIEEVLQEVFVSLWLKRSQIDSTKSLGGYLFRILKNNIYNKWRKESLRSRYEKHIQDNPEKSDDPLELVQCIQISEMLDELVEILPDKRKEIFLLSREQGLSNKEIAHKLGISVSTVETQLNRSLNFLRKELARDTY